MPGSHQRTPCGTVQSRALQHEGLSHFSHASSVAAVKSTSFLVILAALNAVGVADLPGSITTIDYTESSGGAITVLTLNGTDYPRSLLTSDQQKVLRGVQRLVRDAKRWQDQED